jgi:endogenous inhibitor of DNA gyrase (YacG/DUF329 family)
MIPIRSDSVRWVILVIGGLLLLALYVLLPHTVGVVMGLSFLLVLTAASLVVPPGIYGWLIHAECPTCRGPAEWVAANPEHEPYNERIVLKCPTCNTSKIEWEYRT